MILSIDIGGTAVKMGLVDESGKIHSRHEASVCYDHYTTPILTTVISEARMFLKNNNVTINGIGVSATGQIDVFCRLLRNSHQKYTRMTLTASWREFWIQTLVLGTASSHILPIMMKSATSPSRQCLPEIKPKQPAK